MFVIFISLLPVVLIANYIYKKDKDKEPKKLIIKLLFFGVFSVVPTFILSDVYNSLFPNQNTFFEMLCKFIFGVGLIEEFSKFLPAYFVGIKSKDFDDVYDAILYTTFTALCFAGFENILYVLKGGITTAILRFFTAVPGHACWGGIMGLFVGIAYQYKFNNNMKKYRLNMIYSIIIPALFHGLYDFGLLYGTKNVNLFTIVIAFLINICFIVFAVKKLKKISSENRKLNNAFLNEKNIGLKFLFIGIALIFLMFGLSKLNIFNNFNIYNINDCVNIKEDSINIKIDSYDEIVVEDESYIKVNLIIENTTTNNVSLDLSKFKLIDKNEIPLEQSNSNFENVLLSEIFANDIISGSLYFKKNMFIKYSGIYALVYKSTNEYAIVLDEDVIVFFN